MNRRWNSLSRRWKTFLVLAACCAVIFSTVLYRYISFNLWLDRDSRSLKPYPVVLLDHRSKDAGGPSGPSDDSQEKQAPTKDSDPRAQAIDRAILAANSAGRLAVHLSRSEIRYDWMTRQAYVKVFLETALPGEPQKVQRIKCLNILEPNNGDWRIAPNGIVQLTLP